MSANNKLLTRKCLLRQIITSIKLRLLLIPNMVYKYIFDLHILRTILRSISKKTFRIIFCAMSWKSKNIMYLPSLQHVREGSFTLSMCLVLSDCIKYAVSCTYIVSSLEWWIRKGNVNEDMTEKRSMKIEYIRWYRNKSRGIHQGLYLIVSFKLITKNKTMFLLL